MSGVTGIRDNQRTFYIPVGNNQTWYYTSGEIDELPFIIGFSVSLMIVGMMAYNSREIETTYTAFGLIGIGLFAYSIYEAVLRNMSQYDHNASSLVQLQLQEGTREPDIEARFMRLTAQLSRRDQQAIAENLAFIRAGANPISRTNGPGTLRMAGDFGESISRRNASVANMPFATPRR